MTMNDDETRQIVTDGGQPYRPLIPQDKSRGVFRSKFGLSPDEMLFVSVPTVAGFAVGARYLTEPSTAAILSAIGGGTLWAVVGQTPFHLTPYTLLSRRLRFKSATRAMPLVGDEARDVPGVSRTVEMDAGDEDKPLPVGIGVRDDGTHFAQIRVFPRNVSQLSEGQWLDVGANYGAVYDAKLAKAGVDCQVHVDGRQADAQSVRSGLMQAISDASFNDDQKLFAAEQAEFFGEWVESEGVLDRSIRVVVTVGPDEVDGIEGVRPQLRAKLDGRDPVREANQRAELLQRLGDAFEVVEDVGGAARVASRDELEDSLRKHWTSTDVSVPSHGHATDGPLSPTEAPKAATGDHTQNIPDDRDWTDEEDSDGLGERAMAAFRSLFGDDPDTSNPWGPIELDEKEDYVEIDGGEEYATSMWISGWPVQPGGGMLSAIIGKTGAEFSLSIHHHTTDRRGRVDYWDGFLDSLSTLTWRKSAEENDEQGADDTSTFQGQVKKHRDHLQDNEVDESLVSVTVTLRADDPETVKDARSQLRDLARRGGLTVTPTTEDQRVALKTTAPVGNDVLNETYRAKWSEAVADTLDMPFNLGTDTRFPMSSDTVGTLYPFAHGVRQDPGGVCYGMAFADHPTLPTNTGETPLGLLQIDRERLPAPHRYFISKSGGGKTFRGNGQTHEALIRNQGEERVVVIDIADNFDSLAKAHGGEKITFGETTMNPFAINDIGLMTDMFCIYLRHNAEDGVAEDRRPSIREFVTQVYRRADSPEKATMHDFFDVLEEVSEGDLDVSVRGTDREKEDWAEAASDLLTRLAPFNPPGDFDFLAPENGEDATLPDFDSDVILFDGSNYQEREGAIKGMMATLIVGHATRVAKGSPEQDTDSVDAAAPDDDTSPTDVNVRVVIDEAHDLFQDTAQAGRLETVVRAGRNMGLMFDFYSQASEDFDAGSADIIAQQCPVCVLGSVDNRVDVEDIMDLGFSRKQSQDAYSLEEGESSRPYSEALVKVNGSVYKTRYKVSEIAASMIDYAETNDGRWRPFLDAVLAGDVVAADLADGQQTDDTTEVEA